MLRLINEQKEGKLLHLEHLEEVIYDGVSATRQAIYFLTSIRDMLAGHSPGRYNVTTKFDGAPSVVCGINPENGKFFVASKSAFNATPKLNYTNKDIDTNHGHAPGLASKLKTALRYLPELNMRAIYQGDFMYTSEDIKDIEIDGVPHISFQPNTIVYAIPKDSDLARKILASKMGVVFHTIYSGRTIADLKASFNVTVDAFGPSKNVWYRDARIHDVSGAATFTENETKEITAILSRAGNLFREINPMIFNRISSNSTIKILIKAYNNKFIRNGEDIADPAKHVTGLIQSIEEKYNKEVLSLKKPEAIRKKQLEKKEVISFFRNNILAIRKMFELQNELNDAKLMCVRKLENATDMGTFTRTEAGLKVTKAEGFVVSDHVGGSVVKLVDRLEFSRNNFNTTKNWVK